jgi:hypothetical protein
MQVVNSLAVSCQALLFKDRVSAEVCWVKYSNSFDSETRFGIPSTSPVD